MPIPFIDLQAQRARLGQPLEDAILKVVRSGAYIMGPEIAQFEKELGAFGQAPYVLSCGSGTEALQLPLMAWGVGPGDAIKQSIDWVKDNFGKVFLILLVAYLVYYVGVLLCCIGVLATGPIALISIIHSYRALNQEPVVP